MKLSGRLLGAAAFAAALSAAAPSGAWATDLSFDVAVLQGLDKTTARVMTIEAPVGRTVRFGTLEVVVRTCRKRPPEEPPESAAFLDVWERKSGETAEGLFHGWMFASSPAVSALEHPVYDIWVVNCQAALSQPKADSEEEEPAAQMPVTPIQPVRPPLKR